jgi:hypothetical protein
MTTVDAFNRRRVVAGCLMRGHWRVLVLYTALLVVLFAVFCVGAAALSAHPRFSYWEWVAGEHPKYFMVVLGIFLSPVHLPVYVAHGVTRRDFLAGSAMFGGLLTLGFTAFLVVGYGLESAVFSGLGWTAGLGNPHLYTSAGQVGLVVAESVLMLGAHFCAGWLVGTGFQRFGRWWGVGFGVLALLPALGVDLVLDAGIAARLLHPIGLGRPDLPIAILSAVVLVGVALVVNHAITRTSTVRAT